MSKYIHVNWRNSSGNKHFLISSQDLLREKEQYLGILAQLKDFDEERSRELAARAYQERERKRLEVGMNLEMLFQVDAFIIYKYYCPTLTSRT